MPEGDSLFRLARRLAPLLEGQSVLGLEFPRSALQGHDLVGQRIEKVEARGKNLLVRFGGNRTLHLHLRMTGRVTVLRNAAVRPWPSASLVLDVEGLRVVCTGAPRVRLLKTDALHADPRLRRVGPDLLGGAFDAEAALRNLRARGAIPIGEALMDQRALAGIGNIYKSELLFRHGLDPFAPVERFTDDELRALVADAEVLLRKNAEARSGRRITRKTGHPADHSVYLRARRPCFDCGALVRSKAQALRTTYYCPRCQAPRA